MRAIKTLQGSDVIICENINTHRKLLSHLNIKGKRLLQINSSNEINSVNGILKLLDSGKKISLVTDAGTPGISDPGAVLVRKLHEKGVKIIPVPGPSSLTTAISVSYIPCNKFAFLGFLPKSKSRCKKIIDSYISIGIPIVFFVSKHSFENITSILSESYPYNEICICKELTKVNETIFFGECRDIPRDDEFKLGEFVFILSPHSKSVVKQNERSTCSS